MKIERIDAGKIQDWQSFHALFASVFQFPAFYGNNMDAWIDCMSDLAGLTEYRIAPNETLMLHIVHAEDLRKRHPEILQALLDCAAFVNGRILESSNGSGTHNPSASPTRANRGQTHPPSDHRKPASP